MSMNARLICGIKYVSLSVIRLLHINKYSYKHDVNAHENTLVL